MHHQNFSTSDHMIDSRVDTLQCTGSIIHNRKLYCRIGSHLFFPWSPLQEVEKWSLDIQQGTKVNKTTKVNWETDIYMVNDCTIYFRITYAWTEQAEGCRPFWELPLTNIAQLVRNNCGTNNFFQGFSTYHEYKGLFNPRRECIISTESYITSLLNSKIYFTQKCSAQTGYGNLRPPWVWEKWR